MLYSSTVPLTPHVYIFLGFPSTIPPWASSVLNAIKIFPLLSMSADDFAVPVFLRS
jgi:hypothetical protein